MSGEKNIAKLIGEMTPILQKGEYIFSTVKDVSTIDRNDTICEFKEAEGTTIVITKTKADKLGLSYDYVASWITLSVHSSLEAVGLTAIFSAALAKKGISCNVIAGYYHDHVFTHKNDANKALSVLKQLAKNYTLSRR